MGRVFWKVLIMGSAFRILFSSRVFSNLSFLSFCLADWFLLALEWEESKALLGF